MIWPMLPGDVDQVRHIATLCGRPAQPKNWYFTHPTLVAIVGDKQVLGFTSYTVALMPGFGNVMYGQDICVHPDHRGLGIATDLHAARLQMARDVGVKTFMGTADPTNKAIVQILEKSGLHRCLPVSDNSYLYVGPIEGA
jgi:GNAT superfamily N-acetyltransferase